MVLLKSTCFFGTVRLSGLNPVSSLLRSKGIAFKPLFELFLAKPLFELSLAKPFLLSSIFLFRSSFNRLWCSHCLSNSLRVLPDDLWCSVIAFELSLLNLFLNLSLSTLLLDFSFSLWRCALHCASNSAIVRPFAVGNLITSLSPSSSSKAVISILSGNSNSSAALFTVPVLEKFTSCWNNSCAKESVWLSPFSPLSSSSSIFSLVFASALKSGTLFSLAFVALLKKSMDFISSLFFSSGLNNSFILIFPPFTFFMCSS